MSRRGPQLLKTSGDLEPYHEQKLRSSLRRSGADDLTIKSIVKSVRARLHDGMTTSEVFRLAHRELRRSRRPTAARYSLQRALLQLGPTGFPFERFVAELLKHDGYRARTDVVLRGRFVAHEIDVDAARGNERVLAECKFRGQADGKVDIKVALYVHARAEDLSVIGYDAFWLITNGRFTGDALAYGKGVGLRLLSWDHPAEQSLRDRIDRAGLHPITCLSSLHAGEKQTLLQENIVLCADLNQRREAVGELRLSSNRTNQLWREIDGLCGGM
jgi:Restriction endonuclease